MHILLTNDDGIFAPGLAALYQQLTKLGKVSVAAPAEVRSGAGHSISLGEITCDYVELVGKFCGWSVDGSPADCVKLALNELIGPKEKIDLVVSGMNHGANVGINVFYSGTVAGAIEAAFYNLPAIAVSAACDEPMDFANAAHYALQAIQTITALPAGCVININIPKLSDGAPKGIRIVPQSTMGFEECYQTQTKNGQTVYKLTGGNHRDQHPAFTDVIALQAGYITMTALRKDLTDQMTNELLRAMPIESAALQMPKNE